MHVVWEKVDIIERALREPDSQRTSLLGARRPGEASEQRTGVVCLQRVWWEGLESGKRWELGWTRPWAGPHRDKPWARLEAYQRPECISRGLMGREQRAVRPMLRSILETW